ncbi:hypothetical protein [Streptantibioticus silvisoli]|uniref:Uncharacterized protein n=1 Tax=Streptantibioticus silvisoli TaxID=2705255 RepID=A0ABT6W565_9ACTN|nr:hypothetical protein [Streptantibioticus silvisoli]MDI5965814.1 hypothetical protein [Streptantibioticus silvisoli]
MTAAGTYRLNTLYSAIRSNPGQQWTTTVAMNALRADGISIDRHSARRLLAAIETDGGLTRIDHPNRRYWVTTQGAAT